MNGRERYVVTLPSSPYAPAWLSHWGKPVTEWPEAAKVGYRQANRLARDYGNGALVVVVEDF